MRQLRNDEVREDELYCVAYLPGLTELRWGVMWRDGIAHRVPGHIVLRAIHAVSPLAIFPDEACVEWSRGRPVLSVREDDEKAPQKRRKRRKKEE